VAKSFGAKQGIVAGDVTVWLAIPLGMTPRRECFLAFCTLQTGPVPIFTDGGHSLGKVHFFPTSRTLRHSGGKESRIFATGTPRTRAPPKQ